MCKLCTHRYFTFPLSICAKFARIGILLIIYSFDIMASSVDAKRSPVLSENPAIVVKGAVDRLIFALAVDDKPPILT
jgi:hypothetical protein